MAALPRVSILLPLYNEKESIVELYERVRAVMLPLDPDFEILFVDDGSTDGSAALMDRLFDSDTRVRILRFRRNFGKAAALAAGFCLGEGRNHRHPGRGPAGPARGDPPFPRENCRGGRPRVRVEVSPPRPDRTAAGLAMLQPGDPAGVRRAAPRHELRLQGVSARGGAEPEALRRAAPLHPPHRPQPRLPHRRTEGHPCPPPPRPLQVRVVALLQRILRPVHRDDAHPLSGPPAAHLRDDRFPGLPGGRSPDRCTSWCSGCSGNTSATGRCSTSPCRS